MTRKTLLPLAAFASLLVTTPAPAAVGTPPDPARSAGAEVHYRYAQVAGVRIFYREAGPRDAPVVLLLHGFPTSSFMFRQLIPQLATRYHVVAPDYPGFGQSDFPPAGTFRYTFADIADTMRQFTHALGLSRYAIYIQDYGAPVGLRMALLEPASVTALIVQNGNAYEEGLSDAWGPLRAFWSAPGEATRRPLADWLTPEGIRGQYLAGLPETLVDRVDPDTWTLDWLHMSRPGNVEMQLGLFADYANNVALYPRFQQWLREHRPPTLIVWGRYDPFFTPAGAEAYRRDVPDAELHWLDAGHFALETHSTEIGRLVLEFLGRRLADR